MLLAIRKRCAACDETPHPIRAERPGKCVRELLHTRLHCSCAGQAPPMAGTARAAASPRGIRQCRGLRVAFGSQYWLTVVGGLAGVATPRHLLASCPVVQEVYIPRRTAGTRTCSVGRRLLSPAVAARTGRAIHAVLYSVAPIVIRTLGYWTTQLLECTVKSIRYVI
jgi:hypothetical protein